MPWIIIIIIIIITSISIIITIITIIIPVKFHGVEAARRVSLTYQVFFIWGMLGQLIHARAVTHPEFIIGLPKFDESAIRWV